jgi:hypothetical protein
VKGFFDGAIDHLNENFDGGLELSRHAAGGTPGNTDEDEDEDHRQADGERDAVEVESPKGTMPLIHREMSQVVPNVFR